MTRSTLPDTIFALSSGRGRSGVAVIRVSGPKARTALEAIAGPAPDARQAVLRDRNHGTITFGSHEETSPAVIPANGGRTGKFRRQGENQVSSAIGRPGCNHEVIEVFPDFGITDTLGVRILIEIIGKTLLLHLQHLVNAVPLQGESLLKNR